MTGCQLAVDSHKVGGGGEIQFHNKRRAAR